MSAIWRKMQEGELEVTDKGWEMRQRRDYLGRSLRVGLGSPSEF